MKPLQWHAAQGSEVMNFRVSQIEVHYWHSSERRKIFNARTAQVHNQQPLFVRAKLLDFLFWHSRLAQPGSPRIHELLPDLPIEPAGLLRDGHGFSIPALVI